MGLIAFVLLLLIPSINCFEPTKTIEELQFIGDRYVDEFEIMEINLA